MTNEPAEALSPVVAIYQNPDHVAGLVQQLYGAPLVTSETRDIDHNESSNKATSGGAQAGFTATGGIAGVGELGVTLGGSGSRDQATAVATATRTSQSFVYSQAYYLNVIRTALRGLSLIKPVRTKTDARRLRAGDFVEFTAEFAPSTIPAIMDVLTPDLVAAITEWRTRKVGRDSIDFTDFEGMKAAAAELDQKARSDGDLARSIAAAMQSDFRQEKTREYYGAVPKLPGVTAVTICDSRHFVVEDEDRTLDGTYTVLAKVASPVVSDLPVFDRNKLLRNLSPEAVDAVIDSLTSQLQQSGGAKIGGQQVTELLDLDLSSRVPGLALRVIPIAIFV